MRFWHQRTKITVILMCILLVAACSNSVNSPTDSPENSAEDSQTLSGDLRMVTFMDSDWGDQLQAAIDDYKLKHPQVNIELESMPYQNYSEAIKTQLIGGIAADVIMVEPPMALTLGGIDELLPLDSYLDQLNPYSSTNKPWKDDFVAPFLDSSRDAVGDAKLIPWSLVWVGMFYNQNAYDNAGITAPPTTWNEFLETNEKLKLNKYNPMYVSIQNNDAQTWWMFQTMVNAMFRPLTDQINLRHQDGWKYNFEIPGSINGELYTVDELYVAFKKGLIDPAKSPEYRKAVELILQMKPYFNDNLSTADGSEVTPEFLAQRSAQMYSGTFSFSSMDSEIAKMDEDKAFKWDVTNFPSITQDNYEGLTAGGLNPMSGLRNGWVVSKSTENPELAVDFLQFLTSKDEVSKLYSMKRAKSQDSLQPDTSAVADIAYTEEAKKVDAEMKFAELSIYGFGLPPVFDTGKDFEEFHTQWYGLLTGEFTTDEFLEKRSASNLAALERNLKQYADQVDQAFIDEQLK